MATSREMKEIYDSMERICIETGELLKALDDLMIKQGFRPTGTALRWDTSDSINNPDGWLPYFSQRMYRKETNTNRAVGVNIIFKDPDLENKIFFISCGLIDGPNAGGKKSDEFYWAGWREEDKPKQLPGNKIFLTEYEECKIWNYFIPLDIVNDLEKLERYIVKPLVTLYNAGSNPEREVSVSDFGITIKEIKAD